MAIFYAGTAVNGYLELMLAQAYLDRAQMELDNMLVSDTIVLAAVTDPRNELAIIMEISVENFNFI